MVLSLKKALDETLHWRQSDGKCFRGAAQLLLLRSSNRNVVARCSNVVKCFNFSNKMDWRRGRSLSSEQQPEIIVGQRYFRWRLSVLLNWGASLNHSLVFCKITWREKRRLQYLKVRAHQTPARQCALTLINAQTVMQLFQSLWDSLKSFSILV